MASYWYVVPIGIRSIPDVYREYSFPEAMPPQMVQRMCPTSGWQVSGTQLPRHKSTELCERVAFLN